MDKKKKAKKTAKSTNKREKKLEAVVDHADDFEIQLDFADDTQDLAPVEANVKPKEADLSFDESAESLHEDEALFEDATAAESEEELTLELEEFATKELVAEELTDAPADEQTTEELAMATDNAMSEQHDEAPPEVDLPYSEFEEIFAGELDQSSVEGKSDAKDQQDRPKSSAVIEQSLNFTEALNLEGQVEALLFASAKPLKSTDILEILQEDSENDPSLKDIEKTIQSLMRWYEERAGGFRLESIKGQGYQFQTVPAAAALMERLFSSRPRPLSRAALETLSIIAYRQPVTRADVEYVRGVDAGSIIKNLMDRNLIACVGRKEDSGRPMLFGTTDEFLKVFRLQNLTDLPPLAAFQPSPEAISKAMDDLNDGENREGVDVEAFIGDESQEKPELSQGLTDAADVDEASIDEAAEVETMELELDLDLELSSESNSHEDSSVSNAAGQDFPLTVEVDASEGSVEKDEAPERTIQGAVFHAMDADPEGLADGDDHDQDSKISVTDGTEFTPGGGEMDSGGSHRRERAGDKPARDTD